MANETPAQPPTPELVGVGWMGGKENMELREKIKKAINSTSAENGSNTPDFILAEYLTTCLDAFDKAVDSRDAWYGVKLHPGWEPIPKISAPIDKLKGIMNPTYEDLAVKLDGNEIKCPKCGAHPFNHWMLVYMHKCPVCGTIWKEPK